jgi:Flp pilus assembly protein TadD
MNVTTAASAATRLRHLCVYLEQDPANTTLLGEACDAALACGQHEQAEAFIGNADRLAPGAPEWQLRRAQLCIARGDLAQARTLLEELRRSTGEHPAVVHDLAYVHLLSGDPAAARALLQPWIEQRMPHAGIPQELLQALWLRACHHLGLMQEAWEWTQRAQAARALQPAAAGVASLIALDLDQLDLARTLADAALAADAGQAEALVTRASLTLAAGNPGEAALLFERAQQRLPQDGRVWSGLGFAHLLAGDAAAAAEALERALQLMPEHIDTWHALGWARMLRKDNAAALLAFQAALEQDDTAAEAHASLALALALTGDKAAALSHLARAEQLDPQDAVARVVRAVLAGKAGQSELAALLRRLLDQWSPRP